MKVLIAIFCAGICVASFFAGTVVESKNQEELSRMDSIARWSEAQQYYFKGNSEVALYLYSKIENEGVDYETEQKARTLLLFLLYSRLAKLHEEKRSFHDSARYILKAIEISKDIDASAPLKSKAEVYQHLQKFDDAILSR